MMADVEKLPFKNPKISSTLSL